MPDCFGVAAQRRTNCSNYACTRSQKHAECITALHKARKQGTAIGLKVVDFVTFDLLDCSAFSLDRHMLIGSLGRTREETGNSHWLNGSCLPVGLLSFLLGLSSALVDGHEVAEHD